MTDSAETRIAQLQMFEQQLQNFSMQRQQFQMQVVEIEQALKELDQTKEKPYKVIGPLMVQTDEQTLQKELQSRRELLDLRIKNLEKQEQSLRGKAETLQQEVLRQLQKEETKQHGKST